MNAWLDKTDRRVGREAHATEAAARSCSSSPSPSRRFNPLDCLSKADLPRAVRATWCDPDRTRSSATTGSSRSRTATSSRRRPRPPRLPIPPDLRPHRQPPDRQMGPHPPHRQIRDNPSPPNSTPTSRTTTSCRSSRVGQALSASSGVRVELEVEGVVVGDAAAERGVDSCRVVGGVHAGAGVDARPATTRSGRAGIRRTRDSARSHPRGRLRRDSISRARGAPRPRRWSSARPDPDRPSAVPGSPRASRCSRTSRAGHRR